MKRPLRIGCVMAVFALLSAPVAAAESGQLPRSFGNAQLAMAVEDLVRRHVVPADTASVGKHSTRTLTVRSQNPHIDHMAYRFYHGALYEQAIYYRRNRVPRGYAGLLLLQQERQVPIPIHHGRAVSGGRAKWNGPSVTSHGKRDGG